MFSKKKERNFANLDEFIQNLHEEGVSIINYNELRIPVILLDPQKYDDFIQKNIGKKIVVETMLNIFYNEKDVFVDIQLRVLDQNIQENYLIYANDLLDFFEALYEASILGLCPSNTSINKNNIFLIQIPKKDQVEYALRIIKEKVKGHIKKPS